jgi:hypothetical protein
MPDGVKSLSRQTVIVCDAAQPAGTRLFGRQGTSGVACDVPASPHASRASTACTDGDKRSAASPKAAPLPRRHNTALQATTACWDKLWASGNPAKHGRSWQLRTAPERGNVVGKETTDGGRNYAGPVLFRQSNGVLNRRSEACNRGRNAATAWRYIPLSLVDQV